MKHDYQNEYLGFVGLGRMGQPMALNLAKDGYALSVFDMRSEQMQPFTDFNHCTQSTSPYDAAKGAAKAITMLPGPVEVETVVLGRDGILEALAPGSMLIDMSTILPDVTDRIAKACAEKGVRFVDAPVGRLAAHADRGECLFMVGAEDADMAEITPILEAMGTTILHCGKPGSGSRAKLVNNYLAITSCWMNAEAMALTKAFGLDLERVLEVIHGTTATNGQLKINYANKVFLDDIEPGFQIDLAHKDLSLIVDSAQRLKTPMPVAAAAREALNSARAAGWGAKDFSALADYACETAGVDKVRLD